MKLSKSVGERLERKDETHMTEAVECHDQRRVSVNGEARKKLRNALRGSNGNW